MNAEHMLAEALHRISPLSAEEKAMLKPVRTEHYPKGSPVLRAGDQATRAAFLLSGALREYYILKDGIERTRSFALTGDLAGSLSDLLQGKASRTWVTAEADSILLCVDWHVIRPLTEKHPGWMRLSRQIAEDLYLKKVEREFELLALDATTRYERAMARWPDLENWFSLKDIASYIGITPVHLSRLRRERPRSRNLPPMPGMARPG